MTFMISMYIMQSLQTTPFLLLPQFQSPLFNLNELFDLKAKIMSSLSNKSGWRAEVTYQKVSHHCGFCARDNIQACHCGAIPSRARAAAVFICRAIVPWGSWRRPIFSCELMLLPPAPQPGKACEISSSLLGLTQPTAWASPPS